MSQLPAEPPVAPQAKARGAASSCGETRLASDMDHEHTCTGDPHPSGCHWCPTCRRWWWSDGD